MTSTTHNITFYLRNIIKGREKVQRMTQAYQQMGGQYRNVTQSMVKQADKQAQKQEALQNRQRTLQQQMDRTGKSAQTITQALNKQGVTIADNGRAYDRAGNEINNLNQRVNRGVVQARRFKFEWLGVMFAGMQIQRTFGGMIKQVTKLLGWNKIFSSIIKTLLLPVLLPLTNVLIDIMEWFQGLSKETRRMIGSFLVVAFVLGTFLMILGAVSLAVNSISRVMDNLIPEEALKGLSIFGFKIGNVLGGLANWIIKGGTLIGLVWGLVTGTKALTKKLSNFTEGLSKTNETTKKIPQTAKKMEGQLKNSIVNVQKQINTSSQNSENSVIGSLTNVKNKLDNILNKSKQDVESKSNKMKQILTGNFDEAFDDIEGGFGGTIKDAWKHIKNFIENNGRDILTTMKKVIKSAADIIGEIGVFIAKTMIEGIISHIPVLLESLVHGLGKLMAGLGGGLSKSLFGIKNPQSAKEIFPGLMKERFTLDSFQSGGTIPETGPYLLHEGETVIPSTQPTGGTTNITVNANVSSDYDVRELAEKLNRYMSTEFQRAV